MNRKKTKSLLSICSPLKAYTALAIIVFSFSTADAQLSEIPVTKKVEASSLTKSKEGTNKRKKATVLNLPFWDDFSTVSTASGAGLPSNLLWQEGGGASVVSGMGINAPSVNVISLDGLKADGNPYGTDPLPNGSRDTLTSLPIDLSISKVSSVERNTVFLSFFFQWRGHGEAPDAIDYFRVEFLDKDSVWVPMATIQTNGTFVRDQFYDTLIQVSGEQFFHENFQFRFRNFGRLSGRYDNWNIDYVYLNKNRTANDSAYPDGAFASAAGPLFGSYYSVPLDHFGQQPFFGNVTIDVKNMRGDQGEPDPYTYRTNAVYTNYSEGIASSTTALLTAADRPVKPGNPLLMPYERVTTVTLPEDAPDASQIDVNADSASIQLKFLLQSNDNSFYRANDTVNQVYQLKNYYAYDDGSSEYAVYVNEAEDLAAYRFDLPEGVNDLLTGFDIHVVPSTVNGFMTANFTIYETEGELPSDVAATFSHVIRKTKPDGFQRIVLPRPIPVSGTFFVGWKGSYSSVLYVGKDASHDTGDRIYVNAFGTWVQNTSITGSLMIRPVFSANDPITGVETKAKAFAVYPNPSQGTFYVEGNPDAIEVFSITGAATRITTDRTEDRIAVSLTNPSTGIYLVRLTKGSKIETSRIVIY